MKIPSAFALGVLFSFSLAQQVSAAPQFGQSRARTNNADRVCVYQDVRFVGWEQCFDPGDEIANLGNHENAISSVRVYGRARVTVYENNNFKGRSDEFTSDVSDLNLRNLTGSKSWSDHIKSLRVSSDAALNGYPNGFPTNGNSTNRFPNQQGNESICVYDRANYQGREQCWNSSTDSSSLARIGAWSDRISSIRVTGGARAVAYRDADFRGQSIVIDRSIPNLNQIAGQGQGFLNWDRQISSIQFESDRGNGARGRGRARGRQPLT